MIKSEPQRYLNASILKGVVLDDVDAERDPDLSVAEALKTHDSAWVTVCGIALGHEFAEDFS